MSGSAIIHKVPVCPATVLVYISVMTGAVKWPDASLVRTIGPLLPVISKHEINNLGMNCCGSNVKITGVKSVYGGYIHQVN